MTEQEYTNSLGNIVFDDNNQERKSWFCLEQACSRSLSVLLSQLFVIFLNIFACIWRILLSKTCDESTVWVRILCSAAGYILPSARTWTSQFLQKNGVFISLVCPPETGKSQPIYNFPKIVIFQQNVTKITFFKYSQPLHDAIPK